MALCTVGEHRRPEGEVDVYVTNVTAAEWARALYDWEPVEYCGRKYRVAGATPVVQFRLTPVTDREPLTPEGG